MKKYINTVKKLIADRYVTSSAMVSSKVKQVSFTFDDVPHSAFQNAQPILDKFQCKGTFYISLSFLDTDHENENFYCKKDLVECHSNGHELGCHTYNHIHFYQNSNSSFIEKNINLNQVKLNALGINENFENFSYPYGEQTKKSKKIVSKFYKTCRGIDPGINQNKIDLHNLKAIKLYESLYSIEKIFSILDDFNKSGGWLIFYTHDVQSDFSYCGCSPEYFEKIVQKCKDQNIDVLSIKDGVKNLR